MNLPEFLQNGTFPRVTPGVLPYTQLLRTFPLEKTLPSCQYIDMVCVYCGGETKVTNSRHQKRNNQVWRRRQCLACKAVFTTNEAVDMSSALLVEKNGQTESFLSDLLFADVLLAMIHRKDRYTATREAVYTIVAELLEETDQPSIKSTQISLVTSRVLARLDEQAWLRFTAEHKSLQN